MTSLSLLEKNELHVQQQQIRKIEVLTEGLRKYIYRDLTGVVSRENAILSLTILGNFRKIGSVYNIKQPLYLRRY